MAEMTKYEPGTPSWVDLGSPDLDASKAFYGELFGWEAETAPDPAAGGYTQFLLRGRRVAGLGPLQNEGQPPSWTTYVTVEDVDATVRRAEENGGKTLVPTLDVLDAGRMAILVDPTGAVVSLWQPMAHIGAELVNEPSTLCWNELLTRDVEAAKTFYGAVFGWGAKASDVPGMTYTEWTLGDRSVGGLMDMGEMFPPEVPAHWMVNFGTADVDASVVAVERLGGRVLMPPASIEGVGRFASVADPHGAVFSLFQF